LVVQVTQDDLHSAFNTVDVLMVLMYITSHFESNGIDLSILDVIAAFCHNSVLTTSHWIDNVAQTKKVSTPS
jgi:uncharacterized ferritin-like protein (DUF455 family)